MSEATLGRILIVDDEDNVGRMLEQSLRIGGFAAQNRADPEVALQLLKEEPFDIVISDLRMPNIDGIELLRRAKRIRPQCEVVVMTAYGTVATAREALKLGAADFLTKPFSVNDDLVPLLRDLLNAGEEAATEADPSEAAIPDANEASPASVDLSHSAFDDVVGRGPTMQDLLEKVHRVARSDSAILLRGESGTGKEIIANLIRSLSDRRDGPFIKVNCAALPDTLLESELFGCKKGAFTGASQDREGIFEAADGGTLFLDEIGEISSTFQPKLLRVLQDGEFQRVGDARNTRNVDVRIITATNRNLEEAVANGSFRQDLYYRLCVLPLDMPLLRDHIEDLQDLLDHFFDQLGKGRSLQLDAEAMNILRRYPWPGNVRELASLVQYALVMCEGNVVKLKDLPVAVQDFARRPEHMPEISQATGWSEVPSDAHSGEATLEEIERRCILQAIQKTHNNRTKAANLLGVSRRTLGYRIVKYGLEPEIEELQRARGKGAGASGAEIGKVGSLPASTPRSNNF